MASVDNKKLESRPVTSVGQALQGVVPGLNVSTPDAGGKLDANPSFNIRGTGNLGTGSSASPLVLIDGVAGDLNSLNPQDIDNISVLMDAASAAIYGSRAPFGVILVTTKKVNRVRRVFHILTICVGLVRPISPTCWTLIHLRSISTVLLTIPVLVRRIFLGYYHGTYPAVYAR